MDGRWKKEIWNYYDYLNYYDLEGFNRQLNRFLHGCDSNIFKFVNHIKGIDQKNSLRIIEYRKDPLDYGRWSQSAKQFEKETKLQRLMDAYKKGQISLLDYLNAIAANIEITQYIDDDLVIDYDEEVEEQSSSNNDRRSAESLPEIENVSTLLAETSLCEHDQQIGTSSYLRELEEEGEADI